MFGRYPWEAYSFLKGNRGVNGKKRRGGRDWREGKLQSGYNVWESNKLYVYLYKKASKLLAIKSPH